MFGVPHELVSGAIALLSAFGAFALHKLASFLSAKTSNAKADFAIGAAEDIVTAVMAQMAVDVANDLSDGKLSAAEMADLVAKAERLLGDKGLAALKKFLGLEVEGVKDWLGAKFSFAASMYRKL